MFSRRTALALGAVIIAGGVAAPGLATHSWGTNHWRTSNGVAYPQVIDNTTTAAWRNRVAIAVADWKKSPRIGSILKLGTADVTKCNPANNTIQVCNAAYGSTGWLGIASISLYNGHIVAASVKLNETYFSMPQYSGESWKQLVTCQEIGHDYGLTHQDENFATDTTTSCMDYTNLPAGNEKPNAHDYEQLLKIYNHTEIGTMPATTTTSAAAASTADPALGETGTDLGIETGNGMSEWGRAQRTDREGRPNSFVRNVRGFTVVTHVTWAPDYQGHKGRKPDHEH